MIRTWVCPKCGQNCIERPALSRRDNKTSICPDCGQKEAMEDYERAKIDIKEDR